MNVTLDMAVIVDEKGRIVLAYDALEEATGFGLKETVLNILSRAL